MDVEHSGGIGGGFSAAIDQIQDPCCWCAVSFGLRPPIQACLCAVSKPVPQPRVTRDPAPIIRPTPVSHLSPQDLKRLRPHTPWDLLLPGCFLNRPHQLHLLFLQRAQDHAEQLQSFNQPRRSLHSDRCPRLSFPPFSCDMDVVRRKDTSAHRRQSLAFPHQLLPLPASLSSQSVSEERNISMSAILGACRA